MVFYKYHGTGNDFIIVNNLNGDIELPNKIIQYLCQRHFGIGADGFISLEPSDATSFYMSYYNADGSLSSMCGNGGRCAVLFAKHLGIIKSDEVNFEAADGYHYAQILKDGRIALKMIVNDEPVIYGKSFVINTGSPHCVRFTFDVEDINVLKDGRTIRNSVQFKKNGINVNFVEEKQNSLFVRTYERGVENETLSCGTGVVAAAICLYSKQHYIGIKNIPVDTLGGRLNVQIEGDNSGDIKKTWLIGPAQLVYKGEIEV